MSVYCDWVRTKFLSATSIPVWYHIQLFEQICPWGTLACYWDVKQPTDNNSCHTSWDIHVSSHTTQVTTCPVMPHHTISCHARHHSNQSLLSHHTSQLFRLDRMQDKHIKIILGTAKDHVKPAKPDQWNLTKVEQVKAYSNAMQNYTNLLQLVQEDQTLNTFSLYLQGSFEVIFLA